MQKALATRYAARTPGMPPRMERLRFFSAPAGGDGTAGATSGDAGTGDQAASGDQGDQGDADAASGTTDQGKTENGAQHAQNAADTSKGGDGLPDDPTELKAMIADLRKENASARTNAKAKAADEARTALVQELGKALGLVKDGEDTPKPEELAAQAQAAQAQAREAAVQLAVYRAAGKHQGDPDALLDSRAFLEKVGSLDPTAEDFTTKVDAAIKAAVDTNPKLKATQAAARSGNDLTGRTGEQRTSRTPRPLSEAVAGAYAGQA